MLRKLKLKSNGLNKSMPSLVFDNNDAKQAKNAASAESCNFNNDDDMSLIEGNVHLKIILPNGTSVETDVDAKTPMMDLLVQVTTSNGIVPGGLYLKVPSDRPPGYLHYKPNTPIGKLACNILEIVPKFDLCERPRKQLPKTANQPFEPTIRIQVDLPKNQKTFLRVNPSLTLREVSTKICSETKFNPSSYELRSTKRFDTPLDLDVRLADTGCVDFALIPSTNVNFRKSVGNVYDLSNNMPSDDKQATKSKGIFGCFNKKTKKPPSVPASGNGHVMSMNGGDSSNKPKKRSAPKPPEGIEQLTNGASSTSIASQAKLHQAPLSAFAVDQNETPKTVVKSHRTRQNSDSSSGYHDGGSSLNSPSPEAGCSPRTAGGDSVADAALSEKSSSSGDASLPSKPAHQNVPSAVVRPSRTVSDTSETSLGGTKKKNRAPPPPSTLEKSGLSSLGEKNTSDKTVDVHVDKKDNADYKIVSSFDVAASKTNGYSQEIRLGSSKPSNLDEIIDRNSSPDEKINSVSLSTSDESKSIAPSKELIVDVSLNDTTISSINDGRKSWLYCSPSSQESFIESTGPSPPVEEDEPQPALLEQQTKVSVPQHSPYRPSTYQLKDPKRDSFPSTMAVKSFEEEYYSKKASNDLRRDVEMKSNVVVSSTTKREEKMFTINSNKTENAQLQKEYEKLQTLFTEWQNRLNRNESIIKNGGKLSSDEIVDFQKMQSIMMEQHRLVQTLCVEPDIVATTISSNGASKSAKIDVISNENRIQLTPMNNVVKSNERRSPASIAPQQKLIASNTKIDDRRRNSTQNSLDLRDNSSGNVRNGAESNVDTSSLIKPTQLFNAVKSSNTEQRPSRVANRTDTELAVGAKSNRPTEYEASKVVKQNGVSPSALKTLNVGGTGQKAVVVDAAIPPLWTPIAKNYNEPAFKNVTPKTSPIVTVETMTTKTSPAFKKPISNGTFHATPTTSLKKEIFVDKPSPTTLNREKSPPTSLKKEIFVDKPSPTTLNREKSPPTSLKKEIFVDKPSPTFLPKEKSATLPSSAPPPPPPPAPPMPPMLAEMKNFKLKPSTTTTSSTSVDRRSKGDGSSASLTLKANSNADPKDELMRAIRQFGGSGGLKKVPSAPTQIRMMS